MSRLDRDLGPVSLTNHGSIQFEQLPALLTGSVGPASSLHRLTMRDGNPWPSHWCYLWIVAGSLGTCVLAPVWKELEKGREAHKWVHGWNHRLCSGLTAEYTLQAGAWQALLNMSTQGSRAQASCISVLILQNFLGIVLYGDNRYSAFWWSREVQSFRITLWNLDWETSSPLTTLFHVNSKFQKYQDSC